MKHFLFSVSLLCWLCVNNVPVAAQESTFGHRAKPNEVNSKGKPVLYYVSGDLSDGAVTLTTDYGYMVVNEGKEKQPKPLFILASAKKKRVETYTSLADFKKAIRRLPKGTKLYEYDRCMAPAAQGLPASIDTQIGQACRQGGVRLPNRNQPFLTCVCGP